MTNVTLKELNKNDAPEDFGGELKGNDGRHQLWEFGEAFANRHYDPDFFDKPFWTSDDEDMKNWELVDDEGEICVELVPED